MSGGAYDYASLPVTRMAESLRGKDTDPLRRAFAEHLVKVGNAMYKVEWVDSGDCSPGDEHDAIRACLSPGAELEAATAMAREALATLEAAVAHAQTLTSRAVPPILPPNNPAP